MCHKQTVKFYAPCLRNDKALYARIYKNGGSHSVFVIPNAIRTTGVMYAIFTRFSEIQLGARKCHKIVST